MWTAATCRARRRYHGMSGGSSCTNAVRCRKSSPRRPIILVWYCSNTIPRSRSATTSLCTTIITGHPERYAFTPNVAKASNKHIRVGSCTGAFCAAAAAAAAVAVAVAVAAVLAMAATRLAVLMAFLLSLLFP